MSEPGFTSADYPESMPLSKRAAKRLRDLEWQAEAEFHTCGMCLHWDAHEGKGDRRPANECALWDAKITWRSGSVSIGRYCGNCIKKIRAQGDTVEQP